MNRFIGAWKLQSWMAQQGNEVVYPYGKNPSGYISYFSDGLMMVVIMRDIVGIPKSLHSASPFDASDAESIACFRSYLSYWGSFIVDEAAKIVTHKLEGCWYPKWIGTEQKRNFEFKDNLLILTGELQQVKHVLIWEKVGA